MSDKPLFITITSDCCSTCKKLKPVIEELEYLYYGKIEFVTLNISTKETLEISKEKAIELGISDFFNKNKINLPTVGIFCSTNNKESKIFAGEARREIYESLLDNILNNSSHLCSL